MIKYLYFLLLFFTIDAVGQIGINTSDVIGVFHQDGMNDNTIGAVTATQAANDVVVDKLGNMGVGTVTPTAKLHVKSEDLYGAFKLEDGTQGVQRVLLGNADGTAYWGLIKGQGGSLLNFLQRASSFELNTPQALLLDVENNLIEIPNDGSFAFMLRWVPRLMKHGITSWSDPTKKYVRMLTLEYKLMRRRAGTLDQVVYTLETRPFMQILTYQSFLETFIAEGLKKDDKVYLTVTLKGVSGPVTTSPTEIPGSQETGVYLSLNPNDISSVESQMAVESGAVIFFKL